MSENTASHKTNWETRTLLIEFQDFIYEIATDEDYKETINTFEYKYPLGEWVIDLIQEFVENLSDCECEFKNFLFRQFIAELDRWYIGNEVFEIHAEHKLAHDITVPN